MPIDRKKFLTLAMTLALGGVAGCGPKAAPADPDQGGETGNTGDPADEAGGTMPADESMMPAEECVNWDTSGECTEWAAGDEGMYPAQECIDWDAADECIQYEDSGE